MQKKFDEIVANVSSVIYGKKKQIRLALTCLFAGGHLLIEDRPGIGKTTLAKAIAKCLGLDFARIQYTSDLLPGDVLGAAVFEQKTGGFVFHPGPVFTQVLLADEINRATPKTQSALLEAMEERQITTEGETRALPEPFFVIATLNPLEQAGTYALPESQLDRFLMRISIGYPSRDAENTLLKTGRGKDSLEHIHPVIMPDDIGLIQKNIADVTVSDALLEYLQDIIDFTRSSPHFYAGLSPRAGLSVLQAARTWAYLNGQTHVLPEDVQAVLPYVAGHRLHAADSYREFGFERLVTIFKEVPVP